MRDKLLSPNYQDVPLWKDFADAIDAVWADRIDNPQKLFLLLRDTWPYRYTPWGQADTTGYFDNTNLFQFSKEEYIQVNNMLGFSFDNSFFTYQDYQIIYSNLASYYYQKGTPAFINFFGFSINSVFKADVLWTQDYSNFYPEISTDNNTIVVDTGTFPVVTPTTVSPVFSGGAYYPTTHVRLTYDFIKFGLFTPYTVRDFFYYIAPINLVLDTIYYATSLDLTPTYMAIAGEMHVSYV